MNYTCAPALQATNNSRFVEKAYFSARLPVPVNPKPAGRGNRQTEKPNGGRRLALGLLERVHARTPRSSGWFVGFLHPLVVELNP